MTSTRHSRPKSIQVEVKVPG